MCRAPADNGGVLISVLIPTRGRPDKLARCLERLARQSLPHDQFEVLVGIDGRDPAQPQPDPGADVAQALADRTAGSIRAVILQFEHAGPGQTRNRLAAHARGRHLLLLNDDVLPEPDLLASHLAAHQQTHRHAMVLGDAPWLTPPRGEDTLFDRLIRDTSMIFFYDRMREQLAAGQVDADHDWGFRHAWTLNLSLPRDVFESVGGFDARLRFACYEDIEFAYRVNQSTGAPVLFAPQAIAAHDHRILPDDYLRREDMLGRAAWEFAAAAPACALAVFGRDIRSRDELEYSRAFVARESATADRLRDTLRSWATIPAAAIDGPHQQALLRSLYEHHLLLKRWTWRRGLLQAAATP